MRLPLPSTLLALGALLGASALAGCDAGGDPLGPAADSEATGELARLVQVIDGDTIEVELDGDRQRVRLLGIDTPESTTLRTGRPECGGQEATAAARALAKGSQNVRLASDPSQDRVDQYDRLLAYVTPESGGPTWQERLLSGGWAKVYVLRNRPIERLDEFEAAAADARRSQSGIWQLCGGDFRRPQ